MIADIIALVKDDPVVALAVLSVIGNIFQWRRSGQRDMLKDRQMAKVTQALLASQTGQSVVLDDETTTLIERVARGK